MKQNLLLGSTKPNRFLLLLTAVLFLVCPSLHAEWPSYPGTAGISGSYNVLDESEEQQKSTIWHKEYDLNGPGNTLTFSAKSEKLLGFSNGNLKVAQYVDGNYIILVNEYSPKGSYKSYSLQLDKRATKIKFYTETGATGYKYYKDILVTMATYAGEPSETSLDFGSAVYGSEAVTRTATFDWSNTPAYSVSITGEDADLFTASVSNNASAGAYGTATVSVTYRHTAGGTHSAVLHLGDYTIALSGTTTQAAQSIAWATPDTILTTGTVEFNATATTDIAYTCESPEVATLADGALTILTAGTLTLTATAAETQNYLPATLTRTIVVEKAEPTVTEWPTLSALTYGESLSDTILIGGTANIPGVFQILSVFPKDSRTNSEELSKIPTSATDIDANTDTETEIVSEILNAGTYRVAIAFVPTNTAWYTTLTDSATLTINPAAQSIAWATPDTILTTGTVEFNATATTDLAYTCESPEVATLAEGALTILTAGTLTLTATAAETQNYLPATLTRTIVVEKAEPTVTEWPTLSALTYGESLSDTILIGGTANIPGVFQILSVFPKDSRTNSEELSEIPTSATDIDANTDTETETVSEILNAGTYRVAIAFVPANTAWYTTLTDSATLTINPAAQSIAWATPDTILTTGTVEFNATATTDIAYTCESPEVATLADGALTILTAGTLTLTATAAETKNYLPATLTRTIVVEKAEPTVTEWPTLSALTYGESLSDTILIGGTANIPGVFQILSVFPKDSRTNSEELSEILNAGTYRVAIAFIPANTAWYTTLTDSATLTINPAAQSIEWVTDTLPTQLQVGDSLTLTATASTGLEVLFSLDNEEIAVLEGNQLKAISEGTVTITASLDGNDNYLPAEPVTYTLLIVRPQTPTSTEPLPNQLPRATKVLRNGTLYILLDEQSYDAAGHRIR